MNNRPAAFGRKIVRLSTAAAVCGLSLSYIVGMQISSAIDSAAIPTTEISISFLNPFSSLVNLASANNWSAQLAPLPVDLLSESAVKTPAVPERILLEKLSIGSSSKLSVKNFVKEASHVKKDRIVHKVSAMVRSAPHKNYQTIGQDEINRLWISNLSSAPIRVDHETTLSGNVVGPDLSELMELMASERYAYERLINQKLTTSIQTIQAENVTNSTNEPKIELQEKLTKEVVQDAAPLSKALDSQIVPEQEKIKQNNGFTVVKLPDAVVGQEAQIHSPKLIKQMINKSLAGFRVGGIIIGDVGAGHFEVGLYNKIGSDGYPVGAPIIWQSLRGGNRAFFLTSDHKINATALYIFARHLNKQGASRWIAAAQNPIDAKRLVGDFSMTIQVPQVDQTSNTMSAMQKSQSAVEIQLRGRVESMFADFANKGIAGATIRVRGTKLEVRADASGNYSIRLPKLRSNYLLEISQPGYLPSIFSINESDLNKGTKNFELASKQLIQKMALDVGLRQVSSESVVVVKLSNQNQQGLPGYKGQLSMRSDGPYYFTKDARPVRGEITATNFDGRMIFFNVATGLGTFEASMANGETIAPLTVSAIEGGELIYAELEPVTGRIEGRIMDATKRAGGPLAGARVRVEGSVEWTNSDAYGNFSLPQTRFFKDQIVGIEVNSPNFYAHGYRVHAPSGGDNIKKLNLFMFPINYINSLAAKVNVDLDPNCGLIFGSVGAGVPIRLDALSDHSPRNQSKDFYFDKSQDLRGSHAFTDSKFGTFVIFNVPKGRTLLHGYDSTAKLQYANVIHSTPSSVHVVQEQD